MVVTQEVLSEKAGVLDSEGFSGGLGLQRLWLWFLRAAQTRLLEFVFPLAPFPLLPGSKHLLEPPLFPAHWSFMSCKCC